VGREVRLPRRAERGWTASDGEFQAATAKVTTMGSMVRVRLIIGISCGSYAEPMR
jgi:hypothetical protein